jgi:hypothetical protein
MAGGWKKGQSGNPGGRPKIAAEIKELARTYTDVAINTLKCICERGKSESARVAAAGVLLDRGWGKAAQTIDANVNLLDRMSDADQRTLAAALAALIGESEEPAGGNQPTRH